MKYDFLPGGNYGLPNSTIVHRFANLAGDIECGEDCRIDAFVTITGKVKLGERVHIATGACIFGGEGVVIGDGCSLSPGSRVFTATDDVHSDLLANPQLVAKKAKYGKVRIGHFSVIGANAVVLPGVEIGDEVQIGANAVIRTSIPDNQVWAGVPAHYLCPRKKIDRARAMGYEAMENTGA